MNHTPIPSEQDLIAQAQLGNRAAFSELVRQHRQGVVNVAYRLCGDPGLADDIAQEAFLRAWQNLPKYKPVAPFRNWVYRIATNAGLDVLRSQRQTVDIDEIPLAAPGKDPEHSSEDRERAAQIRQAVQALPPASRAVLILREYEQRSYREIAAILDIPLGTVMSRLNYARQQLRQSLAPLMEVA